ncbi:MAG: peptidoglycan-binding protein [Acidimicrobiales bacterium]
MRSSTRSKGVIGVGLVGAVIAAMIWTGLMLGPAAGQGTTPATTSEQPPTALTDSVRRGDLVQEKEQAGSVSFGEPWAAPIDAQGIVTKRHDKGTVVQPGETLIWLDNKPVTLAAGDTPLYRSLQLQGTKKSKHMTGDDVRQLQEFLLGQEIDDKGRLEADGIFGVSTKRAVKAWQKTQGLEETGTIDRSQLVYHPTAIRIDGEPRVGVSFIELEVTEGAQEVKAQFDSKSRPFLPVGGTVDLETGDETIQGTIKSVESTFGDDGSQKLEAVIDASKPLPTGVERVNVVATRTVAKDALNVPVRAVLALAGGGYGLEVETSAGLELRAVELGEIVDDLAEITGDFAEGDQVVVPNDRFGDQS